MKLPKAQRRIRKRALIRIHKKAGGRVPDTMMKRLHGSHHRWAAIAWWIDYHGEYPEKISAAVFQYFLDRRGHKVTSRRQDNERRTEQRRQDSVEPDVFKRTPKIRRVRTRRYHDRRKPK